MKFETLMLFFTDRVRHGGGYGWHHGLVGGHRRLPGVLRQGPIPPPHLHQRGPGPTRAVRRRVRGIRGDLCRGSLATPVFHPGSHCRCNHHPVVEPLVSRRAPMVRILVSFFVFQNFNQLKTCSSARPFSPSKMMAEGFWLA